MPSVFEDRRHMRGNLEVPVRDYNFGSPPQRFEVSIFGSGAAVLYQEVCCMYALYAVDSVDP